MSESNINEQIKAKIDELDLDTKVAQVREGASKAFEQIKGQAGTLLQGNRAKVDEVIEKATTVLDEKTEGKYHDKLAKAKVSFASGLDKIQEGAGEAPSDEPHYDAPSQAGSDWVEVVADEPVAPADAVDPVQATTDPAADPTEPTT